MKKLPFYLKVVSFVLLILIWDYIFINYRNLPLSVPIHFDWDGKPNFYIPRMMIWLIAGMSTVIYFLIFYLAKNSIAPMLEISLNEKEITINAERIVAVFHLIIMVFLTIIAFVSISVSLGKYDQKSPVSNYLIVVLILGIIALIVYAYRISKKTIYQNSIN